MKFTISPKCTLIPGCPVHRAWDGSFIRTYDQVTGFVNIDTTVSDTLYGTNLEMNNKAKQYLCYLANHKILNRIMSEKCYRVKNLEELDYRKYPDNGDKQCYGINKGMGTRKIGIRLRDTKIFLPFEVIMTTMIHELTHMDESGHDSKFLKKQTILREIYTKYEKIVWHDPYNANYQKVVISKGIVIGELKLMGFIFFVILVYLILSNFKMKNLIKF